MVVFSTIMRRRKMSLLMADVKQKSENNRQLAIAVGIVSKVTDCCYGAVTETTLLFR